VTFYPESLCPNGVEPITLMSGRTVSLPKASVVFEAWTGRAPNSTYGHKAILRFGTEPVFAELAILRAFQAENWEGRWIDNFGGKHRVGYWGSNAILPLPEGRAGLLADIRSIAQRRGGCFDVFCWRDGEVIFAEAKWKRKDHIRDSQRRWLEAALSLGLKINQFLIVEWTVA